jgi:hypothetical protein
MEENNLSPELKDIIENIKRYCASNTNTCFVYGFVGFKKDPEHKCEDCGDECEEIDDSRTQVGAYGDLGSLRNLLNSLRDEVEDNPGRDGFVNF